MNFGYSTTSMNSRKAPKVAVSENDTERSFVNSWARRS